MDVEKLFYKDCLLREFQARVTGCTPAQNGYAITLDATAFYPEGGGQACDLGTLADARVLDVREQEGQIVHICHRPLEVGQTVTGILDWERRLDLMQQHTGEHMVSGVIHRLYGYHNVGFHVGADVLTVDFDGPIAAEALEQIEWEVNQGIWENLPVRCWYPSQEELPTVGYRTKKALPWPVRVVEIPGYDKCACCGVHVAFTGQIGLVKLLSCVKFHQGVRIEMVCGGRAFHYLSRIYEQNRQVSQAFSAKVLETGAAARRMNEALAAEKFRSTGLQKQVFAAIAKEYQGAGNVLYFAQNSTPAMVRDLAEAIASQCGGIAGVYAGTDEQGYSLCLVCMDADIRGFGNLLTKTLNGRGGGKAGIFQGNVRATRQQIEGFFARQWSA